jgi:hypothetical protein
MINEILYFIMVKKKGSKDTQIPIEKIAHGLLGFLLHRLARLKFLESAFPTVLSFTIVQSAF